MSPSFGRVRELVSWDSWECARLLSKIRQIIKKQIDVKLSVKCVLAVTMADAGLKCVIGQLCRYLRAGIDDGVHGHVCNMKK